MLLILIALLRLLVTFTVPNVGANQQLLAADTNVHINQTNTNTSNITTNTSNISTANSNISTLQSQMTTANNNITTLQGSPTFTGAISCQGVNLISGEITRIHATGDNTVSHAGSSISHGIGAVPNMVIPVLDESAGGSDIIGVNWGTMSSSSFTAYSSNASGTNNVRFLVVGCT